MFERRRIERRFSPFEDPAIVGYDTHGEPLQAWKFAKVFSQNEPERQRNLAIGALQKFCIKSRNIEPELVLSWITDERVRDDIKVWCKGNNLQLEEERLTGDGQRARRLLSQDDGLIDLLSPYISQINLAKVLGVRRWREADEHTLQTLVSGTYRLLGEYLGPRRYYRRETHNPTLLPLPDLPPEIFEDSLIADILFESDREAVIPIFNKSVDEGFRYLQQLRFAVSHPLHIGFTDRLIERFERVCSFKIPGLRRLIPGSQKDVPESERTELASFPSTHQKEFAYSFTNNNELGPKAYLVGGTGTMKTGATICAMEAVGAKTTLVVCPPSMRDGWENEVREKYEDPVSIVKIGGEAGLRKLVDENTSNKPRYIILGYPQLSRLGLTTQPLSLLEGIVQKYGVDSLIVDEVHLAKEYSADCTRVLYHMSKLLSKEAPRIVMTATAIVNSVEDLDAPVRILFPHDYANPGDFTRAARNDPHFVAALLRNKGLMTRWTTEGILGDELPLVEYYIEPVPLSLFHQRLYEYVYIDSTFEAQVKRGILRQVSIDPLLIRKYYYPEEIRKTIARLIERQANRQDDREREIIGERMRALEERLQAVTNLTNFPDASSQLQEAYQKFLQWKKTENPNETFNEEFLVRLGYDTLAIWAFLNLPDGINSLVNEIGNTALHTDWVGESDLVSSKYRRLKEKLDKLLGLGRNKVIVYSGFYQTGVSTGVEDVTAGDESAFFSLYDHLRLWYGDAAVLKIDGSVTLEPKRGELSDRERVRRAWRLDPSKKLLLATIRSSRLGIDLTIPPIEANKDIERVTIISLDPPDTYADVEQSIGRVRRKGQKIPIDVIFMRTTHGEYPNTLRYGFIDHGLGQALEFKRLLAQMVLDCIPLTEEEERFVKANLSTLHIQQLYPQTPRAYLNGIFFRDVRGRGYAANREYFRRGGFEGISNADFFAAYYAQNDELSLAGHNARAVTEIIRRYKDVARITDIKVGSIGAGAAILQRTLDQLVINIDMLEEVLYVGRNKSGIHSQYVGGEIANIPLPSESLDVTDTSLVLHWTSNRPNIRKDGVYISERARALQELNRVTRYKGLVTITLPYSHLTNEEFILWKDTLEQYFGFQLREDLSSGLIIATDFRNEPISWIFNLEKVSEPVVGFDTNTLSFDFERLVDIIGANGRGERGDRTIAVTPLLPHREFEIFQPGTGRSQRISYDDTGSQKRLEDILLGVDRPIETSMQVLAQMGVEEFGLQRRLVKEARKLWGLNAIEAEELSIVTLNKWLEEKFTQHDVNQMWSILKSLMADIKEGKI